MRWASWGRVEGVGEVAELVAELIKSIVNLCGLGGLNSKMSILERDGLRLGLCPVLCAGPKSHQNKNEKEDATMDSYSVIGSRILKTGGALALAVVMIAGCTSKQDQAIDAAKKQAVATGQAQQVTSVDKNGNTTTTIVQPPAPGQTAQQVTTTTTPAVGPQAGQTTNGPMNGPMNGPSNGPMNGPSNGPGGSTYANGSAAPQQAVAGGAPVIRAADVNIPAGSTLAIRINQRISVKTTPPGARFDGEVVDPWVDNNGRVILPKGTPVEGIVDSSHKRGHFKGASILQLRLTSLELNGTRYPIETRDITRTKKGKGRRSAGLIGGGTGLGMLIGGVASGGTGLLIGGLAGGGAGTAVAGLTGNRDLDIPAESIVRFKLSDDLTLQQ